MAAVVLGAVAVDSAAVVGAGAVGGAARPAVAVADRDATTASASPKRAVSSPAVVRIYRCSKVVKGGRTFSFGALVVAGDRKGNIGIGYGKANEVPPAVEKATKDARKAMFKVNLKGATIPHTVKGTSGASSVVLAPARPGTGVTAREERPPVPGAGGDHGHSHQGVRVDEPEELGQSDAGRVEAVAEPGSGRADPWRATGRSRPASW